MDGRYCINGFVSFSGYNATVKYEDVSTLLFDTSYGRMMYTMFLCFCGSMLLRYDINMLWYDMSIIWYDMSYGPPRVDT